MSARLRNPAAFAHIAPLFVFMLFLGLPGWLKVENPELPWYQKAPEHWVYPLQTLVCGGMLVMLRRHYVLQPWRGLGLALLLALAGIAAWVTPAWLFQELEPEAGAPAWWKWLGMTARREGFDPGVLASWPLAQDVSIFMRFARMVIVVPLVEELFWRGFLMRYLNAPDGKWQAVPFGTHSWSAFGIVTSLVVIAHQPEDYLGALVWGSLVYWLAVRTRSLAACVLMHALGNLLLGIYALNTKQWGFW